VILLNKFSLTIKEYHMKILLYFLSAIILIVSCDSRPTLSERETFIQKVDAFQFLSDYHHQLHIMIGEEEGNGDKAFQEFLGAIKKLDNPELVPVVSSLNRIKEFSVASEAIMKLDYLVDYYQSGLSLQVEAILRGYGYLRAFPIDSALIIYNKLHSES
tara:strand:- start:402 stop:878 length:477 start_codon:yes stop_codon:yes gene_type:complete